MAKIEIQPTLAKKVSTTPGKVTAVPESDEARLNRIIQEQTLAMQEQAEEMMARLNDEDEEPSILIDGISSGYASPKPAEKLYQDQTAVEIDVDTIDDLGDLSISILRPEILISHKGAYKTKNSTSGVGSNKYLDLFAGNVLRDLLHTDAASFSYDQLQTIDPNTIDAAAQRVEDVHTQIDEEVDALVAYRSMINESAISLDLHECSEEIGALMLDSVAGTMQPEDGFLEDLPPNLVELVAASDNVKGDITSSYSNTKLYYSLLATIHETFSGYPSHLGDRSDQSKNPMEYQSSNRDDYSLSKLKKNQVNQLSAGSKSVVRKGFEGIFPGIRNNRISIDLKKYLACLSNELLISCGINRMAGTELGNKYGVTSESPLKNVLGTGMEEMYSDKGVNIPEVNPKAGSLLDFITSEDTDSNRVVLPFEVNDITLTKKKYLPGSDYLVEGPARKLDISFNDPIGKFSNNFAGEVASSKIYLENLLALTESTMLSPQGILIRVLEDMYELCLEAAKPIDLVDRNTMFSAVKIYVGTTVRNQKMNRTGQPWNRISATDTTAIIQAAMAQEEQPEYRLALDEAARKELENTDTFFKSKRNVERYFHEFWRFYIGSLKTDTTSNNVIGVGDYRKLRINIESESESRTVHKMIMDLADELMSEADNFASRAGVDASYKDNQGKTALSKLDYSALIAMIQQIYHCLIRNFFHYTPTTRGSSAPTEYQKCIRLETEKNKLAADAILAVLSTYKEGSRFEDLFDEEGNALSIEGVSSSTKIGRNITMGELTDCIDSLRNHRSYLKCCISALEGIATNVAQKSFPLSEFQKSAREVITNKKRLENVKNKRLAAFCRLVKLPIGSDALRGLTSMQCSNTILSKQRLSPAGGLEKRQKRAVLTPGLLESLRVFHETSFFRGSQNIMCVGLPNGMLDKLKTSNVDEKKREAVTENSGDFSIVFSSDNELYSSLAFEDHSVDFDSTIYLFPDSYDAYQPPEEDEGESLLRSPDPLRDLVNKTVFHRVISGILVESETGQTLIEQGNDKTYEVLRNHVYSDLVRISVELSLMMGISEADIKKYTDLNVAVYSSEGFKLMKSIQKNKAVDMLSSGVEKVLQPLLIDEKNVFYRMGVTNANRAAYNRMTENERNDIVRFASSTLFTAELDRHKILSTSIFDRIFYVKANNDDFELDRREGRSSERKRYLGRTRPNQGNDTFDLTGIYCEIRVR